MKTNLKKLKADWPLVHSLAVDIANAAGRGDFKRSKRKSRSLVKLIDRLILKHGPHPSLLATKAEYVVRKSTKIKLLKWALGRAERLKDRQNIRMIRVDIRELHSDESTRQP